MMGPDVVASTRWFLPDKYTALWSRAARAKLLDGDFRS